VSSITYPLDSETSSPPKRGLRTWAAALSWPRLTFACLLLATLFLYVWGLDRNGWANAYYSAAVQAASKSWKAFFFGSLDASNFITVDKSPAFLWVMDLSARIFGVSTWSVQVPQALEGVATVGVTYTMVRRWFGPGAALLAGAVVALTPVAALMFRYNNPDALLVLLVTGSAYATLRAVESGRTRWLILAAALVGTGFLAKMLQAYLVLPALVLVYAACGRPRLWRRLLQLVQAGAALVVFSGWWVAAVEVWPETLRPYIGGSQTNSVVELIFGYNGLGRITGNETGSVVGGIAAGIGSTISRWGPTGWNRLFNGDFGGQASWLLPAALILMVAGMAYLGSVPRTDVRRAAIGAWGLWLIVTGAVFSLAQGIIHPYYTIALAPPIGALTSAGARVLWQHRASLIARMLMAGTVLVTAAWSYELLDRSPSWHPELRAALVAGAAAAAILVVVLPPVASRGLTVAAALGVMVALAGPAAYTLDTVATAHSGAIPSAGPAVASTTGLGPAGGGFRTGRFTPPGGFPGGRPQGGGGFLNASQVGTQLASMLEANADSYRWVAATVDANSAAGYQLATDDAVMAIGGFNGTDPAPTLVEFQNLVAQGKIHYFIAGGRGGGMASGSTSNAIESWVSQHFTSTTIDGVTLYDLTRPVS
jgi:4-amino-4-deoxy-L-arabinose transferase-like glycosyltransferase